MECSEILRRLAILEQDRKNIEGVWEIIEEFVVPYRGDFFTEQTSENEIDWRNRNLYDSTAILANHTLASSIHGAMTNPSYQWFELSFRDPELNKDADAKKWLQECASILYYSFQESNFNTEISEAYTDLTAFGTNVFFSEKEGKGVDMEMIYKSFSLKECYFEVDHKGNIINFYRRLQMTPIQMASKFGEKGVPAEIAECLTGNKANEKQTVVFCIFKRKNKEQPSTAAPMAPTVRPFGFKYILHKGGEMLGEEGGYYEMPAFASRWRKTSESVWGNSPAMTALPDILTLNQLVQLIIRSAEKVIDPATMVTERGLLSDLDLQPAGLTVVRSLDDMKAYESGARFDVTELQREKLQSSIRDMFHVNELQLKDSPAMTATEVQVRYELMQRLLGPTSGNIRVNLLDPIVNRAFMCHLREGLFPERPSVISDMQDIDIQYTGPLARAQKSDAALATERWIQGLMAMSEVNPDVLLVPDFEAIARGQASDLNVPAAYVRSKTAIARSKKEKEKAAAQMNMIAMMQQGGDAAKAVGEGAAAIEGAQNANVQ